MSAADLFAAARAARARAYAPYSGFAVGAAVRDEAGRIFAGANVENASYPEGWCAETSALAAFIAAGGTRVTEVLVMGDAALCTPCGGCRQRLSEFASDEVTVHIADSHGIKRAFTMADLLPARFMLRIDT